MTDTISIRYEGGTGRITNQYHGERPGGWTAIPASEWPDADTGEDEIARYYYDTATGEVTVEYETVTEDEQLRR